MKAVLGNRPCILPDHSPHPERVLVQVEMSARPAAPPRTERVLRESYRQLVARARKAPEILSQDGVRILAGKTSHLIRRERRAFDFHCASFTGRVIDDRSGWPEPLRGRVAGISVSHPAGTELVVARREFLFPVPERMARELAASVLYGGMAVHAADRAMAATEGSVGVSGSGMVAHMVGSVLADAGRDVARQPGEATVWIETDPSGERRNDPARHIIGVATSLGTLRRLWPRAEGHEAADAEELVGDPDRITDLFFYDAECDWPEWCRPPHFQRYLELAGSGRISLGRRAEVVDLTSPEDAAVDERVKAATASGAGLVFTRFGGEERRLEPTLSTGRSAGRAPGVKRISAVGAGEWPLGMILRQFARTDGVELRGICDRRPEALHLANQALPFHYLTTDYEELLVDEETDMIVVAAYHGDHARLAARALRSGKHCLVEKPPAVDAAQLDDLIQAASEADRMLHVGHNRRFAPATDVLLGHLRATEGPTTVNIVVHAIPLPDSHWYFWPSNGNRIISNMCHFIDYALHLVAPAVPVRVSSTPSEQGRMDRNATVALTFDDGSIASVTYTDRGSDRSTTYYQSYDVMKGDVTGSIEDFQRLSVFRGGRKVDKWKGSLDLGHRRQMAVVAEALRRGGPAPVPLDATALSAKAVLAAAESASLRAPVELDTPLAAI